MEVYKIMQNVNIDFSKKNYLPTIINNPEG